MSRRGTGDGVVAQTASLCREIDECEADIRSLKLRISEMEARHAEQLKTAGQHLLDVQDRLWRVAKAVNSRARSPLDDDALLALEQIRELSEENARLRLTAARPMPSSAVLRIPPEPRKHSDRCGYPRNSCSCGAR